MTEPKVEGDLDKGVVHLHIIKRRGQSEYEYQYLFVNIGKSAFVRFGLGF
jgi:hypothetical protein